MNPFYNYLFDKQQDPAVSHCYKCGTEIYGGDTCYLRGCSIVCDECADEDDVPMTGYELDDYFKRLYGG